MGKLAKFIILSSMLGMFLNPVFSQYEDENYWESLLKEEVDVINPVYRPVIGIGAGMSTYRGDIKSLQNNILLGQPSFRFTVSQYADNNNMFKLNFIFNICDIGANQMYHGEDTNKFEFSNFNTRLFSLGFGFEYGFGHYFKGPKKIRPFVSLGAEYLSYTPQGNLFDETTENKYYPWDDGTIRNFDQSKPLPKGADLEIYFRDSDLESSLNGVQQSYSNQSFCIPVDIGFDFNLTDRAVLRVATSLNLTGTDFLDGYTNPDEKKSLLNNDKYFRTYFTFHYDLWSDDKTKIQENLFHLVEFDEDEYYVLTNDEDYDLITDFADECLHTPPGFQMHDIDSAGCPYDDDNDGIPNYLDQELNTRPGAFVDEHGVTMTADQLLNILDNSAALAREDIFDLVYDYTPNKYEKMENLTIPDKYKFVDLNKDGYISFYEILKAIDDYFDYNSPLTLEDLKDLNDYFFAQ